MATNIFGTDSAAAVVKFEERAAGDFDDWSIKDNIGAHVLFTVKGVESVSTKNYGEREAVRHDVKVVDAKGRVIEEAQDVLTFSAAVVRDLARYAGQAVFAKVGTYRSKYGREAVCIVAPDADVAAAYEAKNAA